VYIERSPWEVLVRSDHNPCTYLPHCIKGKVASWILENLAGLPFKVVYNPGVYNGVADGMSRPPITSFESPNYKGLQIMLAMILQQLPSTVMKCRTAWIYTQQDVNLHKTMLDEFRKSTSQTKKNYAAKIFSPAMKRLNDTEFMKSMQLVILAPEPEYAVEAIRRLLILKTTISDVMIPNTLVNQVTNQRDIGVERAKALGILRKSRKVVFLETGVSWVLINANDKNHTSDMVYPVNAPEIKQEIEFDLESGEQITAPELILPDDDPVIEPSAHILSKERIIHEQLSAIEKKKFFQRVRDRKKAEQREDQVWVYTDEDEIFGKLDRVIVPESLASELIMLTHNQMAHLGIRKTTDLLQRSYYWENMREDVVLNIRTCKCQIAKAKRLRFHGMFRAVIRCSLWNRFLRCSAICNGRKMGFNCSGLMFTLG